MKNLQEKVTTLVDTRVITKFLILGSTATVLPFLIHIQWFTGPIINAILILTLFLVGIRSAFVVCLVPSLMALSGGLLPAILAPIIPFIMISNVIFVLTICHSYSWRNDCICCFEIFKEILNFYKTVVKKLNCYKELLPNTKLF